MVEMQNVIHRYSKNTIIDKVNLSIQSGEIFGLLGPSGAGKTTLVKLIAGILKPTEGTISLKGTALRHLAQMKNYGFMAQSDALYQELTAWENLDFFASIYNLSRKRRKERIRDVLEMVDLSSFKDQPVETFSGGMKRRLSLAAALVHEPELIILDEPTVGIDPVLRRSIWEELYELKEKGVTIIVTTHVMDEAEKCDRLALIKSGKVIALDTPQKLKEKVNVTSMEEVFLHYGGETK
ncbi:heme ABC exporter ATP-binding protein CcmA [Halobacillus litoralis]|uniref:Heme ABC exporter ATP-binding protein CcmA n=1 Tax=Halobacillus litoralis TaxID=45668 RepID=A0A845F9G9_9BACI|nr:heme ABC exporter ATP-binding protein CcmA [Halobacillus litoralis]MYL70326.1 heme ABC exporter ATP-binding protein CcmA [Halobacillus litoralis]